MAIDTSESIIDTVDRVRHKWDGQSHRRFDHISGYIPCKMRNGWIRLKTSEGFVAIRSNVQNKFEQDVVVKISHSFIVAAYIA